MTQDRDFNLDVGPGQIGAVVTYLEMREQPKQVNRQAVSDLSIRRVMNPGVNWYRELFRLVGANWLWFSRLRLNDDQLTEIILDPDVLVFCLEHAGREKGLLELDCRYLPDIELSFLGVAEDLLGKGAGSFLMDYALSTAWSYHPERVMLHTCTIDHPRALAFYQRRGFKVYKRSIEISPDPRVAGILPLDAAPHHPIVA